MVMSPKSNGCGHIAHGRCGMISWAEGRPLREETGRSVGIWMFERHYLSMGMSVDHNRQWQCLQGGHRLARAEIRIKGIKISPYNSKANGRIERPIGISGRCCGKLLEGTLRNGSGSFIMYYGQIG